MAVHVDDITLCTKTKQIAEAFVTALRQHVEVTDGGEINWMLGIEVKYDRTAHVVKLHQK